MALAALTALAGTFAWADNARVGTVQGLDAKALEEAQEGLARYDEPQAAQDFYALKRSPSVQANLGGKDQVEPIDGQRLLAARAQADALPLYNSATGQVSAEPTANDYGGPFDDLGPGNIGGRTKAVVIDPTSTNTMYLAATAGGIWKTTNGGTTWAPLDDFMANLAVNSLAMVPGTPQTLYAGTGEGLFNVDAVRGAGIFKTTDGGTTWAQLATTANSDFHYVNDIVVSPFSASRVYASTRAGVYRSLDAGATWTQVVSIASSGCFDLAIRTDAGPTDRIFVACGRRSTPLTIYRNIDAGGAGTWDPVYSNTGFGRASLAIAPSNQDTVYALAASITAGTFDDGLGAVLRSTTGGASGSWTVQVDNTSATPLNRLLLTNPPFAQGCPGFGAVGFFNQGWYDNVIAVDPLDPDRVWTGGIDLFRSDDGGANFGIASYWYKGVGDVRKAHADQHAITFHPGYNGTTNKVMFVGNDGGVYKTLDARAATATGAAASCDATVTSATVWSSLNNGYQVTQFYDGIPYPNGTTYFGGTQDNGTIRGTNAGGPNAWSEIRGGDGGYVAQDPTNTNVLFVENTGLSLQKSTNGGVSYTAATSGISEAAGNFLFITPFHMAKSNPLVMFIGGAFVWRTTNQATSWVQASTFLGTRISALATFDTDANRALVGTQTGLIFRQTSALTATSATVWPSVTPRAGFVSSLTFHPTNNQIAYATYSTYDGGAHLWRSADGGATWAPREGSGGTALPNIPAHSLAINPDNPAHLYLGTDLGVFVSLDEGLTWARENTGYANVATEKLAINTVGGVNTLFVFSHGRSAWKVPLAAAAAVLPGRFTPLTPARILDTRGGGTGTCTPSPCSFIGGGGTLSVQVAGAGGVPASGVSAVVMNVTVTEPGGAPSSFLTAYPSDAPQPLAANLNYVSGQTVPNLVTVKLGADGRVKLYNNAGTTQVIIDVAGYYDDGTLPAGSRFNAVTPARILDTRNATGTCTPSPCALLGPATSLSVDVDGQGGLPASGVTAVVMNVTVTEPGGAPSSFLTAYPSDAALPLAANLNYLSGQTVPNLVTVKLGADGRVKLYNNAGNVHVIADVAGWYGPAGAVTGARFTPVTPARILDTRGAGTGTCTPSPCSFIGGGGTLSLQVAGAGGVPASGASAVVFNTTVTDPSAASGFMTAYPSDATLPLAANLNFVANQTVPNLVAVKLGADGRVKLYNNAGTTHVIADVAGWFNTE